jgi:hypothetical protein
MDEVRDEVRSAQFGAANAEVKRQRHDQVVYRRPGGGKNPWSIGARDRLGRSDAKMRN